MERGEARKTRWRIGALQAWVIWCGSYIHHLAHYHLNVRGKDQCAAFVGGFRELISAESLQVPSYPYVALLEPLLTYLRRVAAGPLI